MRIQGFGQPGPAVKRHYILTRRAIGQSKTRL